MNKKEHWENVYRTKSRDEVSWFREHLDTSMRMIGKTGVGHDGAVIDVGGGNSTLVDDLINRGFVDVSVLDISARAIADSKERLGPLADRVGWINDDITAVKLPLFRFDLWHDRAVFHFLTDPADRRKYVELVKKTVRPGGHVIVASFGIDGPAKCSGLDVMRYSPETMHGEFGGAFRLVESLAEIHKTPFGTSQEFIYCYCRKFR